MRWKLLVVAGAPVPGLFPYRSPAWKLIHNPLVSRAMGEGKGNSKVPHLTIPRFLAPCVL